MYSKRRRYWPVSKRALSQFRVTSHGRFTGLRRSSSRVDHWPLAKAARCARSLSALCQWLSSHESSVPTKFTVWAARPRACPDTIGSQASNSESPPALLWRLTRPYLGSPWGRYALAAGVVELFKLVSSYPRRAVGCSCHPGPPCARVTVLLLLIILPACAPASG